MLLNSVYLIFNLGGGEIFVILFIVLVLFGSKKIPEFARGLGKGIRQFKEATQDIQNDIQSSVKDIKKEVDETKKSISEGVQDDKSKKTE